MGLHEYSINFALKLTILKNYFTIICLLFSFALCGQGYKIGVRSGLNYSKFRGPVETSVNESFSLSGGFHFGINFTYYPIQDVGLRLEGLYIQNGSNQSVQGDSYTIITLPTGDQLVETGFRDQNLEFSNAYMSFPLTIQVQLNKKFEIFGGAYTNFLIGPTAGGKMQFDSRGLCTDPDDIESCENPEGIFFVQSLIYNYNSDVSFGLATSSRNPVVDIDGEKVTLPGALGAYYYYDNMDDTTADVEDGFIKKLDFGLTGGFNYFLNRGFYIGVRADYGLRDLTREKFDWSLEKVNDDGSFITRDDDDRHFGFQTSFGFRF